MKVSRVRTKGVQVYGERVMGCIAMCCVSRYARGDIVCLCCFLSLVFLGVGCGALHSIVWRIGI